MKERKLIICRGIQGSGKSTWAKQWCHEDPEHRVRFNNDDVRNMLGDYWVPSREKLVTEAKANMITFALIKGYDVVVDNMNLNPKEDAWIRTLCENIEKDTGIHVNIEYKDFWTPVEECIRRDAARPNPIGEKVIKETWRRYRNFIINSDIKEMLKNKAEHVDGGRPVILVDMDATLCLNTSGRPFYGENSASGMLEDTPVEEICRLVRQMGEHCLVFIVTGREGTTEVVDATKEWLKKNEIPSDAMFFRPVGDYSPGPDCKRRIYEENIKGKYNVQFADLIKNGNTRQGIAVYDRATGASRSSNYKKLWIVDIDSKDDEYRNRIISLINECRGAEGDRIKHIIPTVNGYHLISNGFDRQQFSQKLALYQLDQIDIHDNNPTLLYYKTLCQNLS